MNVVKITNKIALVSVALLIYWVFIFICSNVFGFRVFRENMTEMFALSILGIFSILSGAIVLNIMFNLTAIAEGKRPEGLEMKRSNKAPAIIFSSSLVAVFLLLYLGDLVTSKQKEQYLVTSASDLIEEQRNIINRLVDYSFSREYIENSSQDIKVLSKIEEKFPRVTVITRDTLNDMPLLLGFTSYASLGEKEKALKADYILSTSSEERQYLNSVFDGDTLKHRFSSSDGKYEIYYPVKSEKGKIVIHLSQYSRYGKIGS